MSSQATIATIAQFVDQEDLNGRLYNIRGSARSPSHSWVMGQNYPCVAKKAEPGDEAFESLRRLGQESS